jgi:hypothetical protein
VHQQPGSRGADLAGVGGKSLDGTVDGLVDAGIAEDDVGGLAAELESERNDPLCGPVNATLAMSGWLTMAVPTTLPEPVTTLMTPGGKPTSVARRASATVVEDDVSAGLITTVLPATTAGAAARAAWVSGTFHGVMTPMTP